MRNCVHEHQTHGKRHDRLDATRIGSGKDPSDVRRILRKHGYPPDLEAEATRLVLEQAEVLCADWN